MIRAVRSLDHGRLHQTCIDYVRRAYITANIVVNWARVFSSL
ncbi:hypothetical protein CGLAMM_03455 [Acetobacteraceae bacterium EV16G]|uniref:Transposase n=1 Tax=Sorlinia euscelidii TaxID=3081148 RepID=A0ABU7U461_9PROT